MNYNHKISLEDATSIFFQTDDVSDRFKTFFESIDTRYRMLSEQENENLLAEIENKIINDKKNVSDPSRQKVWFDGWQENLEAFRKSKSTDSVTPKFLRPNNPVRFNGNFIIPSNPFFERDMSKLFQIFIYDNFIFKNEITKIYEFGCGSGFNLLFFLQFYKNMIPNMSLVGLDFVQSSVDLIDELGKHHQCDLTGKLFDMKKPDKSYEIEENSCVFTACALEQLGKEHYNFIDYLVQQDLKICFHLEPIVENYDVKNPFDKMAIDFHRKRGYLDGLKPYLHKLKRDGIINIMFDKRLMFGSLFHEGYHLIIWSKND